MGMTATTESTALLQSRFGSTAPAAAPATYYLALSTTAPVKNVDGTISGITEISVGGYARIALANNNTVWTVADGEASAGPVSWTPTVTLTGTQPGYWAIYSASTGGSPLYAGQLDGAVDWSSGSTVQVTSISIPLLDA